MLTSDSLKAQLDTDIRNKTLLGSLTPGNEADAIQRGYDYTDQRVSSLAEKAVSGDDLTEALHEFEAPIEAAQQTATQAQEQAAALEQRVSKLETPTVKTEPVVGDNLLDTSAVTRGKFRHQANGAIYDDDRFYIMATPATPGQSYPHNLLEAYTWFYDADGNSIAKAPAAGGPAPAGTATLGGTGLVGNVPTDMLMWGVAVPASYQPFWKLLVGGQKPGGSSKLPLKGLEIVYVGDSITYQGSYQGTCDAVLQVASSQSFGFVGQTWATALTNKDPGALKERPDAQQAIQGADHVHVHLGTNDPGHGGHLIGQPDDAATAGTLCGDIRAMYEYLRSLNTEAGISFSTPTARGAFGDEPVDPIPHPINKLNISLTCAAIRIMGKVLGVPVVDTNATSGITRENLSFTTLDNLHPNYPVGGPLLGQALGQGLNQLLAN